MSKILFVGDSTVCEFNDVSYYYPRYGYGALFNSYTKDIEVINLALSGRSSKSFLAENNYQKFLNLLSKDDFLIIGFGHNDEKDDDFARFTSANLDITQDGSFKKSLYENYIKIALDRGAYPIICTPIPRLDLKLKYEGNNIHINKNGNYPKAILELASYLNIAGINLTDPLVNLSLKLANRQVLLHAISKGIKKDGIVTYDERSVDKAHLNYLGAKYTAYYLCKELNRINHPISKYFNELIEPKLDELFVNPKYVYKDYFTPELESYKPNSNFICNNPYYGTAFGMLGGENNNFLAKSDKDIFVVGTNGKYGKFNASSDGFAFAFRAVDKKKNFVFKAHAKVVSFLNVKQAGFGLMLRGDSYINQAEFNESYQTNFIASGLITTDASTYINFSRSNPTEIIKELNVINSFFKVGDELDFEIERLGQVVTVKTIYNNKTYENKYIDFDYLNLDQRYIYVGMFSANTTVINFSNVVFTYKNDAIDA